MLQFPNISPDILSIGELKIRWYGSMYVLGFIAAYYLIKNEITRKELGLKEDDVSDLIFYVVLGVVLGGRIGYIFFYNASFYFNNPFEMLKVYEGGMSFHGGLIGVILAGYLYCRKKKIRFMPIADIGAMAGAIGLGLGRIGNFINGELYGRVTTSDFPLAMIFPTDITQQPRHPSQLYESFFEGFLMFGILYLINKKNFKPGTVIGSFIMLYGTFRFFIEYLREPDVQIGYILNYFSMGQMLCFPMILLGLGIILYANLGFNKNNPTIALKTNI